MLIKYVEARLLLKGVSKQSLFVLGGKVDHDRDRVRKLHILVNEVGHVGEVEAKGVFDLDPGFN